MFPDAFSWNQITSPLDLTASVLEPSIENTSFAKSAGWKNQANEWKQPAPHLQFIIPVSEWSHPGMYDMLLLANITTEAMGENDTFFCGSEGTFRSGSRALQGNVNMTSPVGLCK